MIPDAAVIAFLSVDCDTDEIFTERTESGAAWTVDTLRAHCREWCCEASVRLDGREVARVFCDGEMSS